MRKQLIVAILFLAVPVFAGESKPEAQPRLPEVVGITLKPETISITAELNGRASAYLVAEVRPQVAGIIQKRLFEEGSVVKENEPLYQIDPAMYDARLASAEASLTKAKANAEVSQVKEQRYDQLVKNSAVAKEEYDEIYAAWKQAEAEVGIAESEVKIARINVDYTAIVKTLSDIYQ